MERKEWGHSKQYSDVVVDLVKFSPASGRFPERRKGNAAGRLGRTLLKRLEAPGEQRLCARAGRTHDVFEPPVSAGAARAHLMQIKPLYGAAG